MLKSFVDAHQCALTCLATMHDQVASCEEHIAALKVELSAACRRQMAEASGGIPLTFQEQVLEDNTLLICKLPCLQCKLLCIYSNNNKNQSDGRI